MIVEILALVLIAITAHGALAKHPRKRRRYSLRRVRITPELPLATLATDTALIVSLTGVSENSYRAVTVSATWSLLGLTAAEGPITVGYAHSDYTVAEIKACLEANAAISQRNKTVQESANRLVRVIGTFPSQANSVLNHGSPIKTRLNWLITIGESVNAFAFNEGTGTLTTGAVLNLTGNLWVKDSQ